MKKKFLFIALSLTLIFSFTALPSFAADGSSVVSYLDYVYSEEILNQQSNIEVDMNESYLFLFQMNSNRFSLNNANTLILGTRLRDTIQFATTGISQGSMGYVDIRAEVHFADGSSKLSDWVTVSVDNNNPVFDANGVPTVPRWSLQDENADFNWEFDLRDKHDTHIVSIVVLQNFHSQELQYDRWSFWMRAQITDFSIVFNSAKDIIDSIGSATDDITNSIDQNGDKVSDAIDKQTQDLLDASVPGFDSSMNNQNKAEQQLSSGFNTLTSMVERPDMTLDDLSSFTSSFGLLASGVGTIFNSFGGKFRIVWNALVFFGGAALLLGIAVPVAGLASKASRSGSKSQSFKSQKGAKKD